MDEAFASIDKRKLSNIESLSELSVERTIRYRISPSCQLRGSKLACIHMGPHDVMIITIDALAYVLTLYGYYKEQILKLNPRHLATMIFDLIEEAHSNITRKEKSQVLF